MSARVRLARARAAYTAWCERLDEDQAKGLEALRELRAAEEEVAGLSAYSLKVEHTEGAAIFADLSERIRLVSERIQREQRAAVDALLHEQVTAFNETGRALGILVTNYDDGQWTVTADSSVPFLTIAYARGGARG